MGKVKDKAIDRDNKMRIWEQVSVTDPRHTKEVSFGRKFTAIDAHYQVQSATEVFGPVGQGWGYTTHYGEIHSQDGRVMVWCDLGFWYQLEGEEWEGNPGRKERYGFGPIRGASELVGLDSKGKPKRPDTDAYKKAMTDALTKALSHLGFNADVFLGKFDDNKYVQERKKDVEAEQSAAAQEYEQTKAKLVKQVQASKSPDQIDAILADFDMWINRQAPGRAAEIRAWCEKQKEKLSGPE